VPRFKDLSFVLLAGFGLCACEREVGNVFFLAAASTTEAAHEIAMASGMEVRVVTGGSNQLAAQILAGAPAAVFLSADEAWVEALGDRVLEREPLLTNRLCVVTRGQELPGLNSLESLRSLALAGESVPAGRYASEALEGIALPKVIRGRNVREALAWVSRGEVDAAVVYETDARLTPVLTIAYRIPADRHSPIVYSAARLSDSEAAKAFFQFLGSQEAGAIFEKYGFPAMVPE
jgi:molybdate transport system substrate-binding protein